MNKANPTEVAQGYAADLGDLKVYYNRVSTSLSGTAHEKTDIATLAENTLLAAAVGLETFLSDWVLAAINKDASGFIAHEKNRIRTSITDKFGAWHAGAVEFEPGKHVKLTDLRSILDPDGWNLSFKDFETFKQRADQRLAPTYRAKIAALTASDGLAFDAVKAMRNFMAHRSPASKATMNDGLIAVGGDATIRDMGRSERGVNSLGKFLRTKVNGTSRLDLYLDWLVALAGKLA
ncbi:MAG: hypothetical protein KC549_06850 [Myxococcales bacterium]|nr:hypothetical protein [Myxococcales bacterium]MCB9544684.1 hypothetical protein [Myxococcales bacterium]